MDIMAQIRTGQINLMQAGNSRNGNSTQLGQQWRWVAQSTATAQPNILKIDVKVYNAVDNKQYDAISGYILTMPNDTL
jgi:hypothetical protein